MASYLMKLTQNWFLDYESYVKSFYVANDRKLSFGFLKRYLVSHRQPKIPSDVK